MSQPAICIDPKKHRIRIYKQTLHMLGDPTHVQILINPDTFTLAIKSADRKDPLTHRVINIKNDTKQCYELYSRYLIQALCRLCTFWNADDLYKCFGEIIVEEGIACFDLNTAFKHLAREEVVSE